MFAFLKEARIAESGLVRPTMVCSLQGDPVVKVNQSTGPLL